MASKLLYEGISRQLTAQSLAVPSGVQVSEADEQTLRNGGIPAHWQDNRAVLRLDCPDNLAPGGGEIYCFSTAGGTLTVLAGWRVEEEPFSWQPPSDLPFVMPDGIAAQTTRVSAAPDVPRGGGAAANAGLPRSQPPSTPAPAPTPPQPKPNEGTGSSTPPPYRGLPKTRPPLKR